MQRDRELTFRSFLKSVFSEKGRGRSFASFQQGSFKCYFLFYWPLRHATRRNQVPWISVPSSRLLSPELGPEFIRPAWRAPPRAFGAKGTRGGLLSASNCFFCHPLVLLPRLCSQGEHSPVQSPVRRGLNLQTLFRAGLSSYADVSRPLAH